MGDPKYKIESSAASGTREAVKWLIKKGHVSPDEIDGSLSGKDDGLLTWAETVHFAYNSPDWKKYLPALDRMKLKHPLDTRSLPNPIRQRIEKIEKEVKTQIGIEENEPVFCDAFVPAFFKAGLPSFRESGLGFGYPFGYTLNLFEKELTATQAFSAVLNPSLPYGSCSEATYKVLSALEVSGVPCFAKAIETQNHLFPRFDRIDLDPSQLGPIGWEQELSSDRDVAAAYYSSLAIQEKNPKKRKFYEETLAAIDPTDPTLYSLKASDLAKTDLDQAIQEAVLAIESDPRRIDGFFLLSSFLF